MQITTNSGAAAGGSIGGKLFLSLFFAAFLAAGLFFEWQIFKTVWAQAQPYFWTAVECVIDESAAPESVAQDRNDPYEFNVRYHYAIDGETFTNTTWKLGSPRLASYTRAQRLAEKFAPGERGKCWVNPAFRSEAVLVRDSPWGALALLFPLIFVAVGGGLLWATWSGGGTRDRRSVPVSVRAMSTSKSGCVVPFFGIFVLAGAGVFYSVTLRPFVKGLVAKSWPVVPCRILSSAVQTDSSGDSTTYRVDIHYAYSVDGHEHRSGDYDFSTGSSSGRSAKQAAVDRFRPGLDATCRVNPRDPSEAVLDPGMPRDAFTITLNNV